MHPNAMKEFYRQTEVLISYLFYKSPEQLEVWKHEAQKIRNLYDFKMSDWAPEAMA